MAKLYFKYGAMGSSKTAQALITKYNYEENDLKVWLLKPSADVRDGATILRSRIGLEAAVEIVPPETDILRLFRDTRLGKCDVIIVDECHRSIYNVWSQVLEYFDAFIIGLTATPDKRTFAFFNENVVSEYTREQAIIDGVNVGEDVFLIETAISKNGAHIMKQQIEVRSRLSRAKRWKQLDEDVDYRPNQLDRDIVNPSQIRTVVRTFKENLFTTLFPRRKEVPKTLIFAKTDSHADDIIQIIRDEFNEGNDFCRKVTYAAENPESVLSAFRNDYYPRIAVTVDMIATGTDVKPIE